MAEIGLVDGALLPPRFRGRLHQIGFVLAVPAGALLIVLAHGVTARVAATLFVVSLSRSSAPAARTTCTTGLR